MGEVHIAFFAFAESDAEKNAAWERDKATQATALKENKDYDAAHGYAK